MPGTYCEIDLDKEKRDAFVYAIKNHYWYQMYIDDLPIWGKYSLLQTRTITSVLRCLSSISRSTLCPRIVFNANFMIPPTGGILVLSDLIGKLSR